MEMNEWKSYAFSDFVDINPAIKLDSKKEYSFIEMKDLDAGKKYAIPSSKRKVTGGARFEEKDTLFARITPCLENGKICQASNLENGVGFGSTEFLVFRGKKEISDTDFVFYLSRSEIVRKFAEQNLVGTSGRQRVGKEAFQNLEVNVPPLPVQKKIASILSSIDEKIELNRQTAQTLEAMAQAIFKEWFVDFNFPGATGEMQKSELGEIPKGWRVGIVGELFELQRGFDLPANSRVEGKYPVIAASGVNGYHNEFKVKSPGITTGRSGVLGNVFYVQDDFWPLNTSLYVKEFRAATPLYAFYILQDLELKSMNGGSAVPTLNRNEVHKIKTLIPNKSIILEFEKKILPIFQQLNANKEQTKTLTQLRESLLPKLMKGEIKTLTPTQCQELPNTQ